MTSDMETCPIDMSDEDIMEAMRSIPGYLDITPSDFKEIYLSAYRVAVARIRQSIRAGDIMTRDVVFVTRETPLKEVARIIAENGVSGLPVVDDERRVVGIISEKDFLALMGTSRWVSFMEVIAECLNGKGCPAVSVKKKTAEDLMTRPAITASEDDTAFGISEILSSRGINRIPITDARQRLVGIVTRADLITSVCVAGY